MDRHVYITSVFLCEGAACLGGDFAVRENGGIEPRRRGGLRSRLHRYFHVAALLPYFDEAGIFRATVFESAEETSSARFRVRYPGDFIHFLRWYFRKKT
jgi:hypothetical protein